jgi:hypothetical protein
MKRLSYVGLFLLVQCSAVNLMGAAAAVAAEISKTALSPIVNLRRGTPSPTPRNSRDYSDGLTHTIAAINRGQSVSLIHPFVRSCDDDLVTRDGSLAGAMTPPSSPARLALSVTPHRLAITSVITSPMSRSSSPELSSKS